jgi:NADPH-dependent 2,4-dienoyl-CoA reductase/sulfur reductase-like enzyme/rhodanese-related sulfurtransferase
MKKKYIIIGGIAGGISAASRLRRLDEPAKITVFEKSSHAAFASSALPYCIGGMVGVKNIAAMQSEQEMMTRYAIEVKCRCEVTQIDRHQKAVIVHDLDSDKMYRQKYDKLIIATGTTPMQPDMEGHDIKGIFTLKDMNDLTAVTTYLDANNVRRAAVVGGGYIGLEIAESLSSRGIKTCVIEKSSHALPSFDADMAHFARHALEDNSVALITNASVLKFENTDEGIRLSLSNGKSNLADIVIWCTGVMPETTLAKAAGLGIGVTGGILVDEHQKTTDKDIYAVGDAVELVSMFGGKILLTEAPIAIRQGRTAADNICGISSRFKQVLGVSVVKIFDTHMASAGLTESELDEKEIRYEKIYVSGFSREPYFSGAKAVHLKLLFEKKTGRILGAQMKGEEGVDKRIDVLATAMRAGITADKLCDLELAYAPPFAPVKDVVGMAGLIAADVINGLSDVAHWHDIKSLSGAVLLDVRTQKEADAGTIAGSLHIPLGELRSRIAELPLDKEIVVFCHSGQRSYTAERILKSHGYKARNLSGGYALFEIFNRKG